MSELTKLTKPHKEVLRVLQLQGLEVERERPFDPYCVDIYLPKYHVAVEVDGPQHVRDKDDERDRVLYGLHQLLVFHVSTKDVYKPERWWRDLAIFLNNAWPSVSHRKDYADQMYQESGV